MKIIKLYLDFDDTIVDSRSAVVNILNKKYNTSFVSEDCTRWNFTDIFPNLEKDELYGIFESDEFWNSIKFLNSFKKTIETFQDNIKIDIVSKGTSLNLKKKLDFLVNNKIPMTMRYFKKDYTSTDKSSINMSDGIFIDDNAECVRSSNAKIKILLKNNHNTEYNKVLPNDEFYVVNDWNDIFEILKFYVDCGGIV